MAEALQFTVKEGVLNDDIVHAAPMGYTFKGGNVAVLEYYTYANEWGNHRHYRGFKSMNNLFRYIDKHYPELDECVEIWRDL